MAYNGWSYVSFVAGEIKNPQRNLRRAMALGMAGVIALYVGANIAYLNVMTVPEIAATERVGAAVAARIPFAQARDGIFFSRFGRVHPRFKTPAFAIVAQIAWTAVLVVTGSYETLFAYAMLSSWIFYTLGVAAVWVLVDVIVNQPKPSLMALAVCAAGIPFYVYWRTRSRPAPVTVSTLT
jgi:APA family basic amino acid/polyamine antiporter